MIGYVKCFGSNKAMSFRIVDYDLLTKICKNMGKGKQLNEYRV